jgi:hypothetical protein
VSLLCPNDFANETNRFVQLICLFYRKIKNSPYEVLKLNRENKWQTRFLTVSKEGTWLKSGKDISNGDACFCPLALLWVKKLTRSNDHSVTTIDQQGRGGVIFAHLVKAKVENELATRFPLTKKQADKFRDSLVVRIYSDSGDKTSGITFRCTLGTAESIVMGCSAIADVLRGHSPKKSKSRPSSSATDGNMAHSSSQQYVANQAFGTVQLPASIPVGVPSGGMSSGQQYSLSSQSGRMPNNQGIVFPPQQQVFAKSYAESGAPHLWEA